RNSSTRLHTANVSQSIGYGSSLERIRSRGKIRQRNFSLKVESCERTTGCPIDRNRSCSVHPGESKPGSEIACLYAIRELAVWLPLESTNLSLYGNSGVIR